MNLILDDISVDVERVGDIIPDLATGDNGCMFTMNGGIPYLFCLYPDFSHNLLEQMTPCDNGLKLALFKIRSVLTVAAKFGQFNWMDAPYSPHLDLPANLTPMGSTTLMIILFVDSRTGTIKQMSPITLSTSFHAHLMEQIRQLMQMPFDKDIYSKDVFALQSKYTPDEIGNNLKQAYFNLRPSIS